MKILIADPHPEVQSALRLIVSRIPVVRQVSAAGSLVQLLSQCAQTCPDLILFDLDLIHPTRSQPQPLADVIHILRRLCPCSGVLVMSSHLEVKQEVLAAGASGFVSKTDPPDEVLSSILQFLETHS